MPGSTMSQPQLKTSSLSMYYMYMYTAYILLKNKLRNTLKTHYNSLGGKKSCHNTDMDWVMC